MDRAGARALDSFDLDVDDRLAAGRGFEAWARGRDFFAPPRFAVPLAVPERDVLAWRSAFTHFTFCSGMAVGCAARNLLLEMSRLSDLLGSGALGVNLTLDSGSATARFDDETTQSRDDGGILPSCKRSAE